MSTTMDLIQAVVNLSAAIATDGIDLTTGPSFISPLDDPPYTPAYSSSGSHLACDAANCTGGASDVFYFTSAQRKVLWTTTIVGTCLSILGTSMITLSYAIYPSLRTFPYKLIAILSLSDLLSSISYLIPTGNLDPTESATGELIRPHPTTACIVQASLSQFFSLATFLWTAVFSFNIYEVLVQKRSNVEEFERYYHLCCWGVPAILLAINLGLGSFGPTLIWCWIDSGHNGLRMGTFYGPLILIFLCNFFFYIVIGRSLKSMGADKQIAINSRLRQYLVVFFFVRIWSLINRFQNILAPEHPVFFLYFMHAICSTLQGFANSIVYGMNVRVRAHYRALFCRFSGFGGGAIAGSGGHNSSPSATGGLHEKFTHGHHHHDRLSGSPDSPLSSESSLDSHSSSSGTSAYSLRGGQDGSGRIQQTTNHFQHAGLSHVTSGNGNGQQSHSPISSTNHNRNSQQYYSLRDSQ